MKDVLITMRVTEAEKETLKLLAARRGFNVSQFIREAIREYIKQGDLQ